MSQISHAVFLILIQAFSLQAQESFREKERKLRLQLAKLELCEAVSLLMGGNTKKCLKDGVKEYAKEDLPETLSPFAWMAMPYAVLSDMASAPSRLCKLLAHSTKLAFVSAKNKILDHVDKHRLPQEFEEFQKNMAFVMDKTAELVGERYIKNEDILTLTLGYMIVYSHEQASIEDIIVFMNGKEMGWEEVTLFPEEAVYLFEVLMLAKHEIVKLGSYQKVEPFMDRMISRLAVEDPQSFESHFKTWPEDQMTSILRKLRKVGKGLETLLTESRNIHFAD